MLTVVWLAIDKAYSSAGLLHRDVSYGNVMITPEGRGVLNDWDHAGPKDELSRGIVSLISYQDRSQRPTSVIIGHMGVHVYSPA